MSRLFDTVHSVPSEACLNSADFKWKVAADEPQTRVPSEGQRSTASSYSSMTMYNTPNTSSYRHGHSGFAEPLPLPFMFTDPSAVMPPASKNITSLSSHYPASTCELARLQTGDIGKLRGNTFQLSNRDANYFCSSAPFSALDRQGFKTWTSEDEDGPRPSASLWIPTRDVSKRAMSVQNVIPSDMPNPSTQAIASKTRSSENNNVLGADDETTIFELVKLLNYVLTIPNMSQPLNVTPMDSSVESLSSSQRSLGRVVETPDTNARSESQNISPQPDGKMTGMQLAATGNWLGQFFKTKLCPHFNRGSCANGPKCRFIHDESEKRQLPDLRRTKLCQSYIDNEPCKKCSCCYAHSPDELRTSSSDFYKVGLCRFYRQGKCWNGAHCRFAHGDEELRKPPPRRSWRSLHGERLPGNQSRESVMKDHKTNGRNNQSLNTQVPQCIGLKQRNHNHLRSKATTEQGHTKHCSDGHLHLHPQTSYYKFKDDHDFQNYINFVCNYETTDEFDEQGNSVLSLLQNLNISTHPSPLRTDVYPTCDRRSWEPTCTSGDSTLWKLPCGTDSMSTHATASPSLPASPRAGSDAGSRGTF